MRYVEKETTLPSFGTITEKFTDSAQITLIADAGDCISKKTQFLLVTNTPPWEVSTATAVATLAVEAVVLPLSTSFSSLLSGEPVISRLDIQGNIWYAIADFLERKKKKSIGLAYNSVTKKPLSRVVLRLVNVATRKVVDAVVTDARGVFRFMAKAGTYTLQAVLPGFTFPSKNIKSKEDENFDNIYTGEDIVIKTDNEQLRISVPLDPIEGKSRGLGVLSPKALFVTVFGTLSQIVFYGGFLYSTYASIVYPHPLNYAVFSIYVVLCGIKFALYLSTPKTMGRVTDIEGNPLVGVELGLFDAEFNILLYRTFTSKEGEYCFAVAPGVYYFSIVDTRYVLRVNGKIAKTKRCEFTKAKGDLQFVTERIVAERK